MAQELEKKIKGEGESKSKLDLGASMDAGGGEEEVVEEEQEAEAEEEEEEVRRIMWLCCDCFHGLKKTFVFRSRSKSSQAPERIRTGFCSDYHILSVFGS